MEDYLTAIIREYESDTFNARASRVTVAESVVIAQRLMRNLCDIVEAGGRMSCDGVRLAEMLEDIRETVNDDT